MPGSASEFRPDARMIYEMLVRPKWLLALLRNGYPRFATISQYAPPGASTNEVISFARARMGGAFNWEEVKRYRDFWKGPMALKGILHPADAEKAVSLGIEGIWMSNHGGRQIEALVPSIDALPAVVAAVGDKATVLIDSGIRSGQDVMRALALGAKAAFAGKTFLWAVAALGDEGPAQLIDLYIDELKRLARPDRRAVDRRRPQRRVLHPGQDRVLEGKPSPLSFRDGALAAGPESGASGDKGRAVSSCDSGLAPSARPGMTGQPSPAPAAVALFSQPP